MITYLKNKEKKKEYGFYNNKDKRNDPLEFLNHWDKNKNYLGNDDNTEENAIYMIMIKKIFLLKIKKKTIIKKIIV